MTKTLSFGFMHVGVAFAVVYLMTGDWLTGGLVALVEPCVNTVAYHFHEGFWARRGLVGHTVNQNLNLAANG